MLEQCQMQAQVQKGAVVSGFYYPFARLLTDRLKKSLEAGDIVDEEYRRPKDETQYLHTSCLVQSIVQHLIDQLQCERPSHSLEALKQLVIEADKFLAVFEKEF